MLPAEVKVWLGLSRKAVSPELHDQFLHVKEGAVAQYLMAGVILLEPLLVCVDGSERAKLHDCRCGIFVLNS